jgi:hypothetical protein
MCVISPLTLNCERSLSTVNMYIYRYCCCIIEILHLKNHFLIRSPWLSLPFLERWWNARDPISNFLRESDKRFLTSGIFHESMSPGPLSIPLGLFQIFSKIHGDICEWVLSPVSMSPAISCSPVLTTPAITHFSRIFSDPRCRWYRQ